MERYNAPQKPRALLLLKRPLRLQKSQKKQWTIQYLQVGQELQPIRKTVLVYFELYGMAVDCNQPSTTKYSIVELLQRLNDRWSFRFLFLA
jgi:hypothetical protein